MARYCGICIDTLVRWRKEHGFPACVLPDGRLFVTKSLVDQWVMTRMEVTGSVNTKMGAKKRKTA